MLEDRLKGLIQTSGPLPLSDFMRMALLDPEDGYYTTRAPIGTQGDFTTSPEISQMFGELVGLWLADQWHEQGKPSDALLGELGPGRGTLMMDVRRVLRMVAKSLVQRIHLVEASPLLRKEASLRVPDALWHTTLDDIPDGPLFLVANEFFDALPIRQFVRRQTGWQEICVGLRATTLAFVEQPTDTPPSIEAAQDTIVEICPDAVAICQQIADRISRQGGAALLIDYGYESGTQGDTVQALYDGEPSPVLDHPGRSDLSAHVNFAALKQAASAGGADVFGPVLQGPFLETLGLRKRADHLRENASDKVKAQIEAAVVRLTSPVQMGALFKVLAILPGGSSTPAGFAA